jgi:hypothetical protein
MSTLRREPEEGKKEAIRRVVWEAVMFGGFSLKTLLAASAVAFVAGGANAATFPACSTLTPDATNKLTANVGCVGIAGIGSSNPGAGDLAGMFGQASWSLVQKFDVLEGPVSINGSANGFSFSSTDKNFSGIWSISQALLDSWNFLAIVLKDGNQKPIPTLAYRVNTSSGTWDTPWAKYKCTEDRETDEETCGWMPLNSLSNVQLWVSDKKIDVPPVPVPAAGFLMIGALGGLAVLRRRRRAV